MRILAIETSCDETAIAIAEFSGATQKARARVLSHLVSSQVKLHAKFGGVVPNLAKREHQKNLVPLLLAALKEAGFCKRYSSSGAHAESRSMSSRQARTIKDVDKILEREPELSKLLKKHVLPLKPPDIDAVAVTYGPGLEPALWVGVNFAKALAYLWRKPIMPVNHMLGHLYSALANVTLRKRSRALCNISSLRFPALALLVSGGHTQLVLMRGHGRYILLGETRDDAAGEAFDKVARMLGLGYPGGPEIARLAEAALASSLRGGRGTRPTRQSSGRSAGDDPLSSDEIATSSPSAWDWTRNDGGAVHLPRPMLHTKDYDFSFSGLKTAVFYLVRDLPGGSLRELRPSIAKEFQDATVEVLVKKTIRAAKEYKVKTILLGGGVAANKKLRETLGEAIKKELPRTGYQLPDTRMTGDNALMIALAAYFTGKKIAPNKLKAEAKAQLG